LNANRADDRPNLADLVRDLTGIGTEEPPTLPAAPAAPSGAALKLADLISDPNGEIVFFNDSGFRTLEIETEHSVRVRGQAKKHVTASGDDVTGFNYVTFDNGMTLYFEEDLDLLLPPS
jgi:hypothetical protein